MDFTGKVTNACAPKNGVSARTGNPWISQSFRIEEVDVRYPNSLFVKVFGQDKLNELNLQVGETYKFELDSKANECVKVPGEFFNDISVFKATLIPSNGQQAQNPVQAPLQAPQAPQYAPQQAIPQQQYSSPTMSQMPPVQAPPVAPFQQGVAGGQPTQQSWSQPNAPRVDAQGNPLPF